MNDVLLELLHRLEVVGDAHDELFDSDVRDAIDDAVFYGFIKPDAEYTLPENFSMFTPKGDRAVREVLVWFLPSARLAAARSALDTFHKRLKAFQNLDVRTDRQNDYNDFFSWFNPEAFDEAGNVIREP